MNPTCALHPDRLAVAACSECGRPACAACAQNVAGKPVCSSCVAAIRNRVGADLNARSTGVPPAPPAQYNPPPAPAPAPSYPRTQPIDLSAGYVTPPAAPPGAQTSDGQPLYGAPAPSQPTTAGQPLQPLYPGVPASQPPDLSAGYGAPPAAPGAGAPDPAQRAYGAPPAYGQPPANYGAPAGYGQQRPGAPPMQAPSSAQGNVTLAVVIGVVLIVVLGGGFGYASIAMRYSVPLLSIVIGLIVGHTIRAISGAGHVQGIIAAVCSLLACLVDYGIMYLGGFVISPIAILILVYAVMRGYRIASGSSNF